MGGIIGIFERDGRPLDRATLPRMQRALRHRTAPAGGSWQSSAVGVASLASAPRTTAAGLTIVFVGRLDNADELRRDLAVPTARADAELILGAYERWGEQAPCHLLGDFAFAIWDEPNRRLFCARDQIGTQSFYYHLSRARLLFGSEIKAVLADPAVPRELDDGKIADYLGQAFVEKDRTFYEQIRRLAPGHSLTVTPTTQELRAYWTLDERGRVTLPDDGAHAEAFRAHLTEALRCRLTTGEPTAMLLSGGLDSSGLVCLAQAHRRQWGLTSISTLSAVFPAFPRIDERAFIEQVLAQGEIESDFVSASDTSPLTDVDAMLAHVDEPFFSPNLYVYWALARRAQQRGIRVIVDGIDGDTTVSHGVEYLGELVRRGRWIRAAAECRRLARTFRQPAARFLWHFGVVPACRPLLYGAARAVGRGLPRPPVTVSPAFAREIAWGQRLRDLLGPTLRPATSHRASHYRALTSALVPHCLEVHDKVSAAFGLEHRHPYFDRRLIEFCYGIPARQRLAGGTDRAVQRRALAGVVPEPIRQRVQKSHWGDQFKQGFLVGDRDQIESVLRNPGTLERYVDGKALVAAWRRCRQDGGVGDQDGMNLWLAVTLGLWLQKNPGRGLPGGGGGW